MFVNQKISTIKIVLRFFLITDKGFDQKIYVLKIFKFLITLEK